MTETTAAGSTPSTVLQPNAAPIKEAPGNGHTPKVSVIIPNYNHAPFLAERFDSVLGQSYRDFEIIYLDDASTDSSYEIFGRYQANHRMSGILNAENSGSPFKQWNKGIAAARGEFVWIAESDDSASPRFLKEMVPILEENPGIGLAYCQSKIIDEHSEFIGNNIIWTDDLDLARWKASFTNRGVKEILSYLAIKNTIPNASAVLLRKSAYLEAGGADEYFTYCGDWLMWVKILKNNDIYFNSNPLNFYRVAHAGSVRSKAYKSRTAAREALAVLLWISTELAPEKGALSIAASAHCSKWKAMVRKAPLALRDDIHFLFSMYSIAPAAAANSALWYATLFLARVARRTLKFNLARSR